MEALSPSMGMPFETRQLRSADVVWINERWFLSQGVDILEPSTRARIVQALKNDFAYAAPRPPRDHEPDEFYTSSTRTMHADRYGAPGGTPNHGGSGRCGYVGAFNAKGIGPTSLVGKTADWYHSHGCMWLEEAIREAILGEIADAEFPHGAVPTVAILRINDVLQRPDGSFEPHRAIAVRPNFIRPAHFERSIYFGKGGTIESPQFQDAQRTREAIGNFCDKAGPDGSLGVTTTGIVDTLDRISRQIGHGWFHRLHHGGYFSSNVTVDGELVDFGSFRALPDWRRARTVRAAAPFGDEFSYMKPMVDSLAFYFRKYAPATQQLPATHVVIRRLSEIALTAFDEACTKAFALESIPAARSAVRVRILAEAREAFIHEQQTLVDYLAARPLGHQSGRRDVADALAHRLTSLLRDAGTETGAIGAVDSCKAAMARWRAPRRLIVRENLVRLTNYLLKSGEANAEDAFTHFIEGCVSKSRRYWPSLPPGLVLLAQRSGSHSAALYCADPVSGDRTLIVEGTRCAETVAIFGRTIALAMLPPLASHDQGRGKVSLVLPSCGLDAKCGGPIAIANQTVEIPSADRFYQPPD
ncbi:hypothetical protein J2T07_000421 [Luteibacter jiangsuensis]|uniref:Uncharacterized protein n=1 Tax=Luteibacter jiangsuensis TaxID=637577 RepID=A0ABT9SWA4_9GAMM|nr:hypothetical protein [Luteibacter jiangsuensis]MDQ0008262.1 hypothetical protein [Luteibacter jiangsuensis]